MTRIINEVTMYDDKELIALLAINIDTLYRIRKKGIISSVRIGHKLYTSENAVKAFLDGETSAKAQG